LPLGVFVTSPPPPDEMDSALAKIGADLTTGRIRGLLATVNIDLDKADKAYQRDAEALGASYDDAMSIDDVDWWTSELPAAASQEIEPPEIHRSVPPPPLDDEPEVKQQRSPTQKRSRGLGL